MKIENNILKSYLKNVYLLTAQHMQGNLQCAKC